MTTKWDQVLTSLSGQMTKAAYSSNFGGSAATLTGNDLIIYLPSKLAVERVKNRLMSVLQRAISSVYGDVKIAIQDTILEDEIAAEDELPSLPDSTLETTGFTPVVDSLAQEIGLVPAAIYGVVWRYCQMSSRTCYASQETIAERLGMDRKTANRHIGVLLTEGYIRCLNSKQKGETKVYITTNKVSIKVGLSIEAKVN